MTKWLLVTLEWRPDGLTITGVGLYDTEQICDMMGHISLAWFGTGWNCVMQVFT